MTIHVAITRTVRPGCEEAFAQALRTFVLSSFAHPGVAGVLMIAPAPDSQSREYGILRSFASEAERDDFYRSARFLDWDRQARSLTEGDPVYRSLHGLEAWFRRDMVAPPRWKMAVATWLGVFPLATALSVTLGPHLKPLGTIGANAIFNVFIVGLLTWVVMPIVTRLLHVWLHDPQGASSDET